MRICWRGFASSGSSRRARRGSSGSSARAERCSSASSLPRSSSGCRRCRSRRWSDWSRRPWTSEVSTAGLLVELKSDPGQGEPEHDPRGDRQARAGPRARSARRPVRGLLGEAARARGAPARRPRTRRICARCPQPIRLTLLAALCWSRTAEITDALVDLLIDVVDKIRVQRREPGREGARGRSQAGPRQAGAAVRARRGRRRASRRDRPPGAVPGRAGGDAAPAGQGGQGDRAAVPPASSQGDPRLLLKPLPADAAADPRGARVPLRQPRSTGL